jgi:hypothetical protein
MFDTLGLRYAKQTQFRVIEDETVQESADRVRKGRGGG